MKKYFKSVLLLSLIGIIFNSCKKDDPASNTDKLSGKDWKLSAETVDPAIDFGGVPITDLYNQFIQDCSKDDFINFNSNGTYIQDEGATKCDVSDPQTITGTWAWNSDETILTLTETGGTATSITITKNDGTTLSGTQKEVENGITYTITQTFKKK